MGADIVQFLVAEPGRCVSRASLSLAVTECWHPAGDRAERITYVAREEERGIISFASRRKTIE